MTTKITVMGLDLSITGTGLVVVDRKAKVLFRRYPATLPASDNRASGVKDNGTFMGNTEERIEWILKSIRLALKKFPPDLVIIEGYAFSQRQGANTSIHELAGCVKNLLHRREILFDTKAPNTIKLHLAGDGRASKQDMIVAAKKHWPECWNDDMADAFGCAKWGADNYDDIVMDRDDED